MQLLLVFYSFYGPAFLIQELLALRMYHIIFLLILMIISYIQKENVQLAEFQSKLFTSSSLFSPFFFLNYISYWVNYFLCFFFCLLPFYFSLNSICMRSQLLRYYRMEGTKLLKLCLLKGYICLFWTHNLLSFSTRHISGPRAWVTYKIVKDRI